ncbi:hypothetical protein [Microbacterium sp. 11MF]|uniref:hypothetical protein n=1 Tax=Microbacterium sp. 11MF TaxID=1169146 RepID=UPI000370F368|nr:hypothetical protein [Microbacterium sp. 11MF]
MRNETTSTSNTAELNDLDGPWQYKYVERYPSTTGNHDSLTFDTLEEAKAWLVDNATRIAAHNSISAPEDLIAPAIIKRFMPAPAPWEPVTEDEYTSVD